MTNECFCFYTPDSQKTVAELTKENSEQRHQIAVLKKQVKAIRDDNERLRAELTSSDESGSARAITDSSNEALKDGREESHSAARGSRAPGSGFPSPPRGQPSRTQEQNVDAVQQLIASVQSMVNNAGTVPNEVLALLAELQRIQQQLQVLQPPPQYLDQQLPRQDSGTRSSSGVASLPDEQSRRMGDSIEEQEETQDCSSWTQQPLTFAMLQQQQSSLEQISQQQHQQQISQQHQRLQQQLEILRHLNELKKKGKST